MEDKQFTWIPFYKELAKALLVYKNNRKPLVDWIYSELSKVGSSSLVGYLKEKDGSRIVDIDPFSVFAIFNRSLRVDNRTSFLQMFKEKFGLTSEVPTDFDGIPTVNSMRAFFFSWEADNVQRIPDLWELFEATISDKDISTLFDKVIENGVPRISLTMVLYWVSPDKYLNLDKRNSGFLKALGFEDKYSNLNYEQYSKLIDDVRHKMKEINCSSFPELSYKAWSESNSEKVWMFNGDSQAFSSNLLKMGSSAKGQLQFEQYKTKVELGNAYRSIVSNKDVRIPQMYWEFMHDINIGDIVVVFGTKKEMGKQWHLLYGWGKFVSDYKLDYSDDNPIQREVEWNLPILQEPIEEKFTKNALYFHDVDGINAANIRSLLGINKTVQVIMEKSTNNKYVQLLITNKNLILTGAPGTGKTHLAKEIAKEMLGVESVEALSKDKRFGFVQFHPSYDYTDFVEGLRPTKDNTGNVGFERKDGVFKEFCKEAALNWEDSKKSKQELTEEKSLKDKFNELVIKIENDEISDFSLKTDGKSMEVVKISDYNNIILKTQGSSSDRTYTVSFPRLAKLAKVYPDSDSLNSISNINDAIREAIGGCNASSYWAVLNEVYKQGEMSLNGSDYVIPENKYVFVIDEINRGEISKIFGELFFSIDPGYRGKKGIVKTQYHNMIDEGDAFKDGFYVPENVYIIGTMNDIDRSVESMDFAMRRRFAWEEVTAEESMIMLNGMENEAEIKSRMISLNDAIAKIDGLGTQYQIGAAYFKKITDNKENFKELWDYHLKGLLFEYLRGSRDVKSQMEKLEKAYNRVNSDEPVD